MYQSLRRAAFYMCLFCSKSLTLLVTFIVMLLLFKVLPSHVLSVTSRLMQSLAVLEGCNFGIKACNNETSTKFKAWMSSEGKHT